MEFRKVFDTIPEKFDKWRPQYCKEAFDCIINQAAIDSSKSVLEIGPGTGQATEPILKTNCDYLAIELGEKLYRFMINSMITGVFLLLIASRSAGSICSFSVTRIPFAP